MQLLVLGTRNRKKGLELLDLLGPYDFVLRTLADIPDALEVEETGRDFGENAALKAVEQARHLKQWVLGEDSGLCVDVLDGRPGVFSARYSGPQATDRSNNELLLEELREVAEPRRGAQYVCHVVVADPRGQIRARCEEYCRGRIRTEPAGSAGFGYDPLFEIAEYHQTFGELGESVKSVLSHRSRALRRLLPELLQLQRSGDWEDVGV